MHLDEIAHELYGSSPEEFIAVRKERERQAKAAGDKSLASAIHALSKPNLVAWLLNQLARDQPDEVRAVLALGAELRKAMADRSGDRLRQLSRRQREVVGSLMHHAEQRAAAAGGSVSATTARSLEDSLRAAMADPGAGEALAGGRLTGGLQATGFGGGGSALDDQAVPTGRPPRPRSRDKVRDMQPDRKDRDPRRDEAIARAERAVAETGAAGQEAERRLAQVERSVDEATARVEQARLTLHAAMKAQSEARKELRQAQSALSRTDRADHDARDRLATLSDKRDHKPTSAGSPGRKRAK